MSKQAGAGGVSLFLSVCFFVSFFGGEKKTKESRVGCCCCTANALFFLLAWIP